MRSRSRLLALSFVGGFFLQACLGHKPDAVPNATLPLGCVSGSAAKRPVPATLGAWSEGAQLFDGLGEFHRQITTASPEAQKYFDQGMRLLWGFNHDESTRSFAKAAQLDPSCAMCLWGVALTVGPNYNMPEMAKVRATVAWDALQLAAKSSAHAAPVESALIAALRNRYPAPDPIDESNLTAVLSAYAAAMKKVAQQYPDDLDIQTLYAEAMMNIKAWRLWNVDGTPASGTEEIARVLEAVLNKDPSHPGANHYYIHVVEASPHPERGLASAQRLIGMMPAAGHMNHMPAHILQRLGFYEDAAQANRDGATADLSYLGKTRPPGYYYGYVGHNYQFLASSDAMEGRRAEAQEALRKLRTLVPDEAKSELSGVNRYQIMVRFGRWDEILAEAPPDASLPGRSGIYHYARALAYAATHRVEKARLELSALESILAATPATASIENNSTKDILSIADLTATAGINAAESKADEAVAALRNAVAKEDQLIYDEPADWFFPVRHILGRELLKAGRFSEAELVYREDLRLHPNNGWALFGLSKALESQGRQAEAAAIRNEFERQWQLADTKLVASAF